MKKLSLTIVFMILFTFRPLHANEVSLTPSGGCINGIMQRWTKACKCPDFLQYQGDLCIKGQLKKCKSNNECPQNSYCYTDGRQGSCHKLEGTTIHYQEKKFYFSKEIMNHISAINFCGAHGAKQLTRADFSCNSLGPSCLNGEAVVYFQNNGLDSGFFWLEKNNNRWFYFDIYDGTVYALNSDAISLIQAACIVE